MEFSIWNISLSFRAEMDWISFVCVTERPIDVDVTSIFMCDTETFEGNYHLLWRMSMCARVCLAVITYMLTVWPQTPITHGPYRTGMHSTIFHIRAPKHRKLLTIRHVEHRVSALQDKMFACFLRTKDMIPVQRTYNSTHSLARSRQTHLIDISSANRHRPRTIHYSLLIVFPFSSVA